MAYFKFNDKNIFYSELGTGKPLLLLHGNTASSNMFCEIAKAALKFLDEKCEQGSVSG